MRVSLIFFGLTFLLASCGSAVSNEPRDSTHPPYDGLLDVIASTTDLPEALDRGGSAAQALECEGEIVAGSSGREVYEGSESKATSPEAALTAIARDDKINFLGPTSGFVTERADNNMVLFSLDSKGLSKVTAIAHNDGPNTWKILSWAACDPYEWPGEAAEAIDQEIWLDGEDNRVPTSVVSSNFGDKHCDWDKVWFVTFEWEGNPISTARDPRGDLSETTFEANSTLPSDALDTGFHFESYRLWLSADRHDVYAVTDQTTERWHVIEPTGCD
jgi:hypothetical protein